MIKKLFVILLLLIPINCFAISKNYEDKIAHITQTEIKEDKINVYLFHGAECPHCEEERNWLKNIKKEYGNYIDIYYFEVWHSSENLKLMNQVLEELGITRKSIPLTIIGSDYYIGYSESVGNMIESKIKEYAEIDTDSNEINIPILGKVNMKEVSIPFVAVILGFIDGFNPCAMWILLFLINMLFGMKDRKKAWILGMTFLFVSGFVYFLSMLGINFILGIATIKIIKILIALFILIAGILNFKKYLKKRKDDTGCTVVDDKKRKKIISRMKKIISNKSFILSILGIIVLATSINLIELACSLGFPLIFTEILSINNVVGLNKFIYLFIYIIFYMIDDIFVFTVSMVTLQATGITNKYSKLCTLISSIIMIVIGLLLLFKQDWLMLNF